MKRLVVLLAVCGCGGTPPGQRLFSDASVTVVNDDHRPEAHGLNWIQRVRTTVEVSAAWWGGTANSLDGYQIILLDQLPECGGQAVEGCQDGSTISVYSWEPGCIEASSLAHEIGHAVIGDANHTDPRWRSMESLWGALLTTTTECGNINSDTVMLHWGKG